MKSFLQFLYNRFRRRARLRRLVAILAPAIPLQGRILDLGCGNGDLAAALHERLPGIAITGLDLSPKPRDDVPLLSYDGVSVPFEDDAFDYVMLSTMLHHTDNYLPLMQEARRVGKKGIIIIDHQYFNAWDRLVLACIDWPGNVPFGVYTPYNYKTRGEWQALFTQLGLKETSYDDSLYLFGKYADFLFGRRLHFLSVLEKAGEVATPDAGAGKAPGAT